MRERGGEKGQRSDRSGNESNKSLVEENTLGIGERARRLEASSPESEAERREQRSRKRRVEDDGIHASKKLVARTLSSTAAEQREWRRNFL